MLTALLVLILMLGLLYFIHWLTTDLEWECENKFAYDVEHDMWFTNSPYHECKLCRNTDKE